MNGLHNTHETDRPWTLDPRRDYIQYLGVKRCVKSKDFQDKCEEKQQKRAKERKDVEARAMNRAGQLAIQDATAIFAVVGVILVLSRVNA